MHVADIERELKAAIEHFDASLALRTCAGCGHVHPDRPSLVDPVTPEGPIAPGIVPSSGRPAASGCFRTAGYASRYQ